MGRAIARNAAGQGGSNPLQSIRYNNLIARGSNPVQPLRDNSLTVHIHINTCLKT